MRLSPLLSLAGLLAAPVALYAQSRPETNKTLPTVTVAGTQAGYTTEHIGVGAFRDQSIMDVPATINVATRELMDTQADVSLYEVLRNSAGVSKQQLSGETFDNLAIRGIPLDNRSNYRLNGALPLLNMMQLPLEDKERVEVLKGVSALYYGYTAPGGVVNMVTKRAGSTPVTTLGLRTDNNGSLLGSLDIGRRFGSKRQYGLRVNAIGGRERSPIDGIGGHRRMASVAYDWVVSDRLNLRLDAEYFQRTFLEQTVLALPAAVDGRITLPELPDPKQRLAPNWANFSAHGSTLLAHVDYALNDRWVATIEWGQATVTRDRRAFTQLTRYSNAEGLGTLVGNRQNNAELENRNVRTELFGSFATGPFDHEVTVGAAQTLAHQGAITTYAFRGTQYLYAPITLGWLPSGQSSSTPGLNATDQGLYVTDRLSYGSHWQLVLGERYTHYSSEQGAHRFLAIKTTPIGALIYKFTPQLMVYASYTTGIEQGEGAPNTALNVNERLPPSISRQKEAGLRWQATKHWQLATAAFDIDRAANYLNDEAYFVQGGRERYRGVEFSAQGQLSSNWMLQLSAQSLCAHFASITPSLQGKIPENTPGKTASLFAQYSLSQLTGLSINGGLYYLGRRPVNDLDQATIGGVTTLGFGMRYAQTLGRQRLIWQANVENATNRRYWAATGNNRLAVGLPRTWKLSLKWDL